MGLLLCSEIFTSKAMARLIDILARPISIAGLPEADLFAGPLFSSET